MKNSVIENSLSNYYQNHFILRSSSGTSALIAVLKILSQESKKNEIVIPSNVCPALLFAINFLGLNPVFVDMETRYFNMCMKDLKRKITKKTLAVIGVHCFGLAADIKALVKISREKKIFFIEDACLNFGGKINGEYYGSFGDASIISFGYDKILSENGGAIVIKSKKLFIKIKKFMKLNPIFLNFEFNQKKFKQKFNRLESLIEKRKNNAKKYNVYLSSKNIIKPKYRDHDVYWRYPILYKKNREKLVKLAESKGLIITKHYPAISKFQTKSKLLNADLFEKSILNFFVKPGTKENYISGVCNLIN